MHTPGPWKPTTTYGESTNEPFIVWCDGVGAAIAHVYNRSEMGSDSHATQRANARLIAAAPAMLAACQDCKGFLEAYAMHMRDSGKDAAASFVEESLNKVRAAIALATTQEPTP